MIKKLLPIFLSLISLSIVLFFWDSLKLPYDNTNNIIGEYYYKKFNPSNDILRFILFIGIPAVVYLFVYLKTNKETLSLRINDENFFLNKENNNNSNQLKRFFYFLIFLIIIEFLSIDFQIFIAPMDIFHNGTYLVPPMNYLQSGNFFQSTIHDYGFIANNIGLIYKYFFGYYSLGTIIFTFLLCIFFIKFLLILLVKRIIDLTSFNPNTKLLFFIILSLVAISLPDYYDHSKYFNFRIVLYLFFIYFLGSEICKNKEINYKLFFIGIFSLFSVLWWFDIGAYTNALILLTIIYLVIFKQFKNLLIILISTIIVWSVFYFSFSSEEFKELIFQLKLVYSKTYEYLLGLEYKKPFTEKSGRWTKALMLIYFSTILLINYNFDKKLNLDRKAKIFLNIFFISGILVFKSALMRSDPAHIKYSSGIYTLIFIFLILFFVINFLSKKRYFENLIKNFNLWNKGGVLFLLITVLYFSGFLNTSNFNKNYFESLNILKFEKNISKLLKAKDQSFLNTNTKNVLAHYKKISAKDSCVQVLTDDISFSYLLRKQTCTQSYIPATIIIDSLERRFIDQLKKSNPEIILYESNTTILLNKSNMPRIVDFINKNYTFFENFNGYVFYKKNKS